MRIDEILKAKQPESPILDNLSTLPPMSNAMIHINSTGTLVETPAYDFGVSLLGKSTAADARTALGLGTIATASAADYATANALATKMNIIGADYGVKITNTTAGGVVVFYPTSNGLSTGTPLFSSITAVIPRIGVADGNYGFTPETISSDQKVVTMSCKKQQFNGVTVAGVNVIGSVTLVNAPDGTSVSAFIYGKRIA